MKLGLTGGIGTGKGTVRGIFAEMGAAAIDADRLARKAVRKGSAAWRKIVELFGEGVLNEDGSIDRRRLARIAFGDPGLARELNAAVHPPVVAEMRRLLAEMDSPGGVVVADVPLLYEAGLEGEFDAVVVVTCPADEQVRRIRSRDGLSGEEVEARMRMQMPLEEKRRRADYVVDNSGSIAETKAHVEEIWDGILQDMRKR